MEKEQILDFTRRVTQSNRSGLTLVTYDIFFAYLADAKDAHKKEDWDAFKQSIRQAQKAVQELIDTLNFSYDLAKELYRIYVFAKDQLAIAMYKRSLTEIEQAESVMTKLRDSFSKVAAEDESEPLMRNTQQVYAGYTYGRNDIVENFENDDKKRGFLV